MRLFPVRPDTGAVALHFKKMSQGLLPRTGAQIGYGMLGSRLRFAGHSLVKPRSDNRPVVVKQVTPAEVGLQQAKSELAATHARKSGIKRAPRRSSSQLKAGRAKKQKKKKKKTKTATTTAKRGKNQKKKKKKKPRSKAKGKRKDNFSS